MRFKAINAVVDTRKTCADVVILADVFVYGSASEAEVAKLVNRLRLLRSRVDRALKALEGTNAI